MARATHPEALTIRSMVRLKGRDYAHAVVAMWITDADLLCGGKMTPDAIAQVASMALNKFQHRSVASLLMALRDGIGYTDEDGKVYGGITWPKVSLWLDRHEAQVMGMSEAEHGAAVVKNDNLDGAWMDRIERGSDGEKVKRQARLIDRLRDRLKEKP